MEGGGGEGGTPGRLGDLGFPRSKKSCVYMQYFKSRGAGVWFVTAIAATPPRAFT